MCIRDRLERYRTYAPVELPDFFGGAVGFVTYDYVLSLIHILPSTIVAGPSVVTRHSRSSPMNE